MSGKKYRIKSYFGIPPAGVYGVEPGEFHTMHEKYAYMMKIRSYVKDAVRWSSSRPEIRLNMKHVQEMQSSSEFMLNLSLDRENARYLIAVAFATDTGFEWLFEIAKANPELLNAAADDESFAEFIMWAHEWVWDKNAGLF